MHALLRLLTGAKPSSGHSHAPMRPHRRSCCTRTTMSNRRSTRMRGEHRHSSSPTWTVVGTGAVLPTAKATSWCTSLALRALGDDVPVNLKLVLEGSEEQGTGGLEDFVPKNADLLRADAILVCDTGNAAVGHPAATVSLRGVINVVVTVKALESEVHSGMFGGPAPDALAALVEILATLRDDKGGTTIRGLDNTQTWTGEPYPPEQFGPTPGCSMVSPFGRRQR